MNKKDSKPPESSQWKTAENGPIQIVGIGASAGGLEALEVFFAHTPPDSGMAFVVIQHLSPDHKSVMTSILGKHTKMPVCQVTEGMAVEANRVYLNQPNNNTVIIDGKFQLTEIEGNRALNLPVDSFFMSLGECYGPLATCIILSGTGTDGTLGMRVVKGAGGLTMAQEEGQAKYGGMPRSAALAGQADLVLPVEKMAQELIKYVKQPYVERLVKEAPNEDDDQYQFRKIFAIVRTGCGHDFSNYKQNTTRRRIERRMAVHQIELLGDYIRYLEEVPAEVTALFKDMLIGVTSFFREPEAFEIIKEKIFLNLLDRKGPEERVRIWVPGCATGEEAYSLAIILDEAIEQTRRQVQVQIFATDLNNDAIEFARHATYPDGIVNHVSEMRLARYFIKNDHSYKVKKTIRDMVVFAVHDLIKDPPFSRLDMLSCRNLLIYMDGVLQKKLLPLFHYTLAPAGCLFLGTSETVGEHTHLLTPVSNRWKIYRRKDVRFGIPVDFPNASTYRSPMGGTAQPKRVGNPFDMRQLAERIVLENYAPPSVLINEAYEILYFIGDTSHFLSPPSGEPSFQLLKMAREELRYKLSALLHKVVKQRQTMIKEEVQIRRNEQLYKVVITIRPLQESDFEEDLYIVIFDEGFNPPTPPITENPAEKDNFDPRLSHLEKELQTTREYLQTTIEELETSNEELKSTNEELQSVNEELQSTNEELETSKEELQSTNEELVAVNSELQKKVDELSDVNNDISNLLGSTEIGTIFLDTEICIKRFTPTVTEIFNLIQSDVGRPISDITSNLQYHNLHLDAKKVLDTLDRMELELCSHDDHWFSMRLIPYRTVDNIIDGVVATFVDITKIKEVEGQLALSKAKWQSMIKNAPDYIAILDMQATITFMNRVAPGVEMADIIGKSTIYDLVAEQHKQEAEAAFKKVLKTGRPCTYVAFSPSLNAWYQNTLGPIKEADKVVAVMFNSKEVTKKNDNEDS